jgi:transcriptional regulator with XRE-family HTH domain
MPAAFHSHLYIEFRELLVAKRKKAGLTQNELAEKLSRPQSYVSKYENGERRLDVIEFMEIAEVIGFDPVSLIRELRESSLPTRTRWTLVRKRPYKESRTRGPFAGMAPPVAGYTLSQIIHVVKAICGRGNKSVEVEAETVEQRLNEILERHGLIDGPDEFSRAFREFSGAEEPAVKEFDRIAKQARQLAADISVVKVVARLNMIARRRFSNNRRMQKLHPGMTAAAAQSQFVANFTSDLLVVADLCASMRAYEKTPRNSRPEDEVVNELLMELADLYNDLRKTHHGRFDLPHSESSIFIGFASAALKPLFHASQTSCKALSRRWKRIKDRVMAG